MHLFRNSNFRVAKARWGADFGVGLLRVADAAYLELALRLGVRLATRDASLARAAREAGVPLFTA